MDKYNIVIDSREQKPLFKGVTKKLDVGDYSIKQHENKISIERKSPGDLFGTLTTGHKRFKKEIQRSQTLKYFAIIIECNYTKIRDKDFDGAHHIKMRGYIINKILLTIHMKYGVPVFYVINRNEAKSLIRELFNTYYNIYNKT